MTVLIIRAHKRFAVCRKARLGGSADAVHGLLVELSLDGCRLGNVDVSAFTEQDVVIIHVEGAEPFRATVRWRGERTLGLRLVRPFHVAELDHLIRTCRGEFDELLLDRAVGI